MNISFIRYSIKRYFPGQNVDAVFAILSEYGADPGGYRPDFTYQALLRLANGDLASLREWVRAAGQDPGAVFRAAHNVESWEAVVDSYEKWSADCSQLLPLCRLARQLRAGPASRQFRGGTSVGTLVISAKSRHGLDSGDPRALVVLHDPRSTPGTFEMEFQDCNECICRVICGEEDAMVSLEPLLRLLASRAAEDEADRPGTAG